MTNAQRLDRLEDALAHIATLITEGQPARIERYIGVGCVAAGQALMETLEAIRAERSSQGANDGSS